MSTGTLQFAQALAIGELSEGQAKKWVPAPKPIRFVIAAVSRYQAAKGVVENPLDELGKNHFGRLHPARISEPRSCREHPGFSLVRFNSIVYDDVLPRRLDTTDDISVAKTAGFKEISKYMIERLKTIFPAVHPNPYPLLNSQNVPLFLLFFAVGNPNKKATSLAMKIANHLLKPGSSAS